MHNAAHQLGNTGLSKCSCFRLFYVPILLVFLCTKFNLE